MEFDFNTGYKIYTEFGPDRGIPRAQRLKTVFPDLDHETFHELLTLYQEIERYGCEVAAQYCQGKFAAIPEAYRRIGQKYPRLSEDSIHICWNQGMYFTWREGY